MWPQCVPAAAAAAAGVCYLLVLPAVGDKDVVLHLHAEVQPGEGVTQSHPQRRGIAGHRCHGSHFLLPLVFPPPPCGRERKKKKQAGGVSRSRGG